MSAIRQDSWREQDDQLLADVTLRHIRDGATQLLAFQEAATRLGRTPAACGFRWNSVVRKQHEESIHEAKRQRKHHKIKPIRSDNASGALHMTPPNPASVDMQTESPARFAMMLAKQIEQREADYTRMAAAYELVIKQNQQLDREMKSLKSEYEQMNEDYKSIVQIMERARRMTLFTEETPVPKIRFRMDENGNLEQYM